MKGGGVFAGKGDLYPTKSHSVIPHKKLCLSSTKFVYLFMYLSIHLYFLMISTVVCIKI